MTLQRKTLLIVLITLAGLLVFLYGFVRLLVLDGFDLFEAQSSRRFAELIRGAFLASVDEVDMTSRQYAAWDETLRFVRTRDSRHIESSFSSESFAASRLSFVIIMDLNGETLFEKSFGVSETDKAIPESLRPLLGRGSPLTRHKDAHASAKGMITLPEGVLFIASRPVVSSDMQSPVRGCFVAAKYYDEAMLARGEAIFGRKLAICALNNPEMPADFAFARDAMKDRDILLNPLNDDVMAAYARVNDIFGKPALLMRAYLGREIHQGRLQTQRTLLLSLLASGLTFGTVVIILLRTAVLDRVAMLDRRVRDISVSGDARQRVSVRGHDELAGLADSINAMLSALETSRQALHRSEESARALMNATTESAMLCDLFGNFLAINETAAIRFGRTATEMIGSNIRDLMLENFSDEHFQWVQEVVRTGKPVRVEANRQDRLLDISIHPIFDAEGHIDRFAIFGHDITEERLAEQALRESEKRLRELVEGVNGVVLRWDPALNITFMNQYGRRMFGLSVDDSMALPKLDSLFPDNSPVRRDIASLTRNILENGEEFAYSEHENLCYDGRLVWMAWTNRPILNAGGDVREILSIGIDISKRKQAEEALLHRADMEKLVASMSSRFLNAPPRLLSATVNEALAAAGSFFQADRCYLYLARDGGIVDMSYEWCAPGVPPLQNDTANLAATSFPWFTRQMAASGVVYIPDVEALPEDAAAEKQLFLSHGVRSLLDVAMFWKGSLFGLWGFSTIREARQWSTEDIDMVKFLGEILVAAFRRCQAEDAMLRRIELEALVASLSSSFLNVSAGELDAAFERALGSIGDFAGVDRCGLRFFSQDGNSTEKAWEWCAPGIKSIMDYDTQQRPSDWPSFIERFIDTDIVMEADIEALPPEAEQEKNLLRAVGIRSFATVPLIWKGNRFGLLSFNSTRPRSAWQEDDINILRLAGEIFANAYHQARDEEELLLQKARLETLVELDRLTECTFPQLSSFVLRGAIELTRSASGIFALVDEHQSRLMPYCWSREKRSEFVMGGEVLPLASLEGGPWAEVIRGRKPVLLNGPAPLDVRLPGIPGDPRPVNRFLAVPVIDGGQIQAVAAVTNKRQPYDTADANQLTLLMNGAWNHMRRAEADEWIRGEINEIADIQRRLLPTHMPDITGMRLAASYATYDRAGGDYYDILPLDGPLGKQWLVFIADASGHGPSAAVVTAIVSALLHACPKPLTPPSQLLSYLNAHLRERSIKMSFVTAFAGIIDLDTRSLTYSSAGHNMPMLRNGNSISALLPSGGLPLGIDESRGFTDGSCVFAPGDWLLLYTDGIVESMSPDSKLFGENRLRDAFLTSGDDSPAEAITRIEQRLRSHESGRKPGDDQTMILIALE